VLTEVKLRLRKKMKKHKMKSTDLCLRNPLVVGHHTTLYPLLRPNTRNSYELLSIKLFEIVELCKETIQKGSGQMYKKEEKEGNYHMQCTSE
jgi:hypothetical protein